MCSVKNNAKNEKKLPKILGLTASPIKCKISDNSWPNIKSALQNLSDNLDATYCPLPKEYLKQAISPLKTKVKTYSDTLGKSYISPLLNVIRNILQLFYPGDEERALCVQKLYYDYLADYNPSSQVPAAEELLKQNSWLTFFLILLVRKGQVLLEELGPWAFVAFLRDIVEELKRDHAPEAKVFAEQLELITVGLDCPNLDDGRTPKLMKAMRILIEKKLKPDQLSLILFVKDKIVGIYLKKALAAEDRTYTSDLIYGNRLDPAVPLVNCDPVGKLQKTQQVGQRNGA